MGSIGKQVGTRRYVIADQVRALAADEQELFESAVETLPSAATYNLLRIDRDRQEVAFLMYPELGLQPFPPLKESWRVHVPTSLITRRNYTNSQNPPILHRTELLLPAEHPKRAAFERLTQACEELGLFENPTIIGFQRNWDRLIAAKGFFVQDEHLVPVGNDVEGEIADSLETLRIERHRTALSRSAISAPVQCLLRDALLTPDTTFFDYGCGKGDDLAALSANGFSCSGWDPHFRPETTREAAAVVNLGFVINVIEDYEERIEALSNAFALAEQVLAVAAMLTTNGVEKFSSYKDGVITRRATFQKYFTQGELQHFIESVVGEDAYAAAPGVFYVFKNRHLEQRYLLRKARGGWRVSPSLHYERPTKPVDVRTPSVRALRADKQSAEEHELLTRLWSICVALGREPELEEVPLANDLVARFGSLNRALRKCRDRYDDSELKASADRRRADLLVMLALRMFERRRRFEALDPTVARDIRHFFRTTREADAAAHELLFSIQDQQLILDGCRTATIAGLGHFENEQALHIHTNLVSELPAVLRIYVGCASAMAGDLASYDLAKIHVGSGKVTLLKYDDFEGKSLPALMRRVKVRLKDQASDIFEYGAAFPSTLLFRKSRHINEEYPRFAEQTAFEEALTQAGLDDPSPHGPTVTAYHDRLRTARYRIVDFTLTRSDDIPSLDEKCGAHFRYRDFVECGETWQKLRPDNAPREAATYNALCDLARNILDPAVDYYGSIKVTYGFASPVLTRHIDGRIAPKLDQHASCEIGPGGRHVCDRLGAAVDFIVEYEDMFEVAKWVATNCKFDRIYIYGRDRPIHVSIGYQESREIYELVQIGKRQVPRRLTLGM